METSLPEPAPTLGTESTAPVGIMGRIAAKFGYVKQSAQPPIDPKSKRLAAQYLDQIKFAKKKYGASFKKMKEDMSFVGGRQWVDGGSTDRYVANVTQRHVQEKSARLYARNPTLVAKRRHTMDFAIWDETQESMNQALEAHMMADQMFQQQQANTAMGGPPPMPPQYDPNAEALLQDIQQGMQRRQTLDRVAKTLEVVCKYQIDNQIPPFKRQMKQMTRRTIVTGVGYVKIGFERVLQTRPEDKDKIRDITEQLSRLRQLAEEKAEGEMDDTSAKAKELEIQLQTLQNPPITREGIVFDFPPSMSIIPDPACRQLAGFIGAQWVAQEFILTPEQVQQTYGVDLKKGSFTPYTEKPDGSGAIIAPPPGESSETPAKDDEEKVCVYERYDKKSKTMCVLAEGYEGFIAEPAAPPVMLERFWPWFLMNFNEVENEKEIFPQSDVTLIRPMQQDYNRSRQGFREARHANRPKTAVAKGMLDQSDKEKLADHPANAVLELNALQQGQKISDVLQVIQGPAITPEMYDTQASFEDIQRVTGTQTANLGGTSDSTATEASISEASRQSVLGSNVDDQDDLLSELAGAMSEICFKEFSQETVMKIAGPGSVWPQLSAQDIADQVYLDVKAGSSGRPNKAANVSLLVQLAPFIVQLGGLDQTKVARIFLEAYDDQLDLTDLYKHGAPSIVAQNALMSAPPPPESMPAEQGNHGKSSQGPGGSIERQPIQNRPPQAPPPFANAPVTAGP